MFKFYLLLFIIHFVKCNDGLAKECDIRTIKDHKTNRVMDTDELCKYSDCIFRFCSELDHLWFVFNKTRRCTHIDEVQKITKTKIEFPNIGVYKVRDDNQVHELSSKDFFRDFRQVAYTNLHYRNCTQNFRREASGVKYYFLEDGSLIRENKKITSNVRVNKGNFIVQFIVSYRGGSWITEKSIAILKSEPKEGYTEDIYIGIGMVISSFFLIAVLVVYSLVSKLQNLAGMMSMAYIACTAVGFAVKAGQTAGHLYDKISSRECRVLCPIWFYALLASFFWMNAISIDLFCLFCLKRSNHRVSNRQKRKRDLRKFRNYSIYAFGAPLLITIFAVTVDHFPDKVNIIVPSFNNCFPSYACTRYLYIPVMILLFCNVLLYLVTAFKIYLSQKAISKSLDSSCSRNTKKNKNRFKFYLKLTLLTGVNWLMDLIELAIKLPPWLSYIVNSNVLVGIAIFIIFICRKNVFVALCERFSISNSYTERWASRVHTSTKTGKASKKKNSTDSTYTNSECPSVEIDSEIETQKVETSPNP